MILRRCATALGILCALVSGTSRAATFSNAPGPVIDYLGIGTGDSPAFGETFTLAQAARLTAWTFFTGLGGTPGTVTFEVEAWNGGAPAGPALFSSTLAAAGSTAMAVPLALDLAAGDYVAILDATGSGAPVSHLPLLGSSSDGGLSGAFRFRGAGSAQWYAYGVPNLAFRAELEPIPEPSALLLAGLGLITMAARRRR